MDRIEAEKIDQLIRDAIDRDAIARVISDASDPMAASCLAFRTLSACGMNFYIDGAELSGQHMEHAEAKAADKFQRMYEQLLELEWNGNDE